jgi:hypothetical protein
MTATVPFVDTREQVSAGGAGGPIPVRPHLI